MCYLDTLDGATVAFINYGAGTCIGLDNGKSADDSKIFGFFYHNGPNQWWELGKEAGSVWPTYKLHNVQSGTCADIHSGTANGTPLSAWHNSGNDSQRWRLVTADASGLVFMIQNVATSTYVDLSNGSNANGTLISGWAGEIQINNPNQLWQILRIN
ncbi:carbohydrate-binding module family 13 protein [Xylaria acuta]|nr:carbohydrate-binding module family 13 protein [Xylaria acuta]